MKTRILSLSLALCLLGCGAGCAKQAAPQNTEVVVFAAASMEATLTELAAQYKEIAPDVTLTFTFDSSGTLKTQIEEGATCDVFISAAQKQMNQLDAADTTGTNTDGLDFVYSDTRIDLVENQVVLAVPDDNPAEITAFSDLQNKDYLLCLGNDDVPVGAYSLQILDTLGISIAALEDAGRVTYASNVSEVARQVKEGAVDCGMIYATDACTYELTVVDQAEDGMCDTVVYPAAVMKSGTPEAKAAAEAFLDFLHTSDAAAAVLEGVGFTVLH